MSLSIFPVALAFVLAVPVLTTTTTYAGNYPRGEDPRLRQIHAQCMLKDAERERVEGYRQQRQVENDPSITSMEQLNQHADQYAEEGFKLFRYCMEAKGALFDESCSSSAQMNRFCYSIPDEGI